MNANWTSGYVSDVTYTLGFYRELAPTFLHFCAVLNGVEGPALDKPLRYCELGCGRGYSTALLAAANPNYEFVGIDFNPSHVAEARNLAARAKLSNVTFVEASFGDAARSTDRKFADFDIVALHGVYTWVERSVRNDIVHFIREKLVAGGLVYNSYNALPGWAMAMPIQHVLMEVTRRTSRDSFAALKEGYELLKTLLEKQSGFVQQNPGIKARIENMGKQDLSYLAHEFLNAGWEPLYITDVMKNFAEAKLTYIGSATPVENRIELCVPRDLQAVVQAAPDLAMRELLKDYAVNKQFRRDLYVKGPSVLQPQEQRARFHRITFALATLDKKLPEKFTFPVGEFTVKKEALTALSDLLAAKPATGAEIIAATAKAGLREPDVVLWLLVLVQSGIVAPVRPDHHAMDRAPAHRLNSLIIGLSPGADSHRFLCAPVTGSAFGAGYLDRIIAPLMAKAPKDDDAAIARKAFDMLEGAGRGFVRDGKTLPKTDENIQDIAKAVGEFREVRLPRWRALGALGKA